MSETVNRLNSRIVTLERQRDVLQKEALDLAAKLRAAMKTLSDLRTCDTPGCKLCVNCLLDIERRIPVTP